MRTTETGVKLRKQCFLLFFVFLLLFSFCGCHHSLTEGEVYAKEFKEAETKIFSIPVVISNGKTTFTQIIPYIYSYPDRWIIRIREPNGDGTYITDEYYTNKEVYDAVGVGDTFSYDPNRDFENEPHTRKKQDVE